MRHKTISIEPEERFLTPNDCERLALEILQQGCHSRILVAVDGAPGSGKSTIAKLICAAIARQGIPISNVSTDLDVLPRVERPPGSTIIDWHGEDLVREVVQHPGANFAWQAYDLNTQARGEYVRVVTPEIGVVILEGLHAIEKTLQCANDKDQVTVVHVAVPEEVRELRRRERNLSSGRLRFQDASQRLRNQRPVIRNYFDDLQKELGSSSCTRTNSVLRFT